MDRVIFLVHSVRGVWLNMFHVFLADPLCLPRRVGGWLLNLVIFGFCQSLVLTVCGCWCLVCFWLGLGFSRPVSAETFFVESLILAQDERWRRA